MPKRKIISIDESRCNGCGLCIPNCQEGAIRIIDGKARLVSDIYCDGLGACLGHCPQGAISIEEREALPFDEAKAKKNTAMQTRGDLSSGASELKNWPVQLMLVPESAPYFNGAHLLIAADCVPFSCADFHRRFLKDRVLLVGCPKLDDSGYYQQKLSSIIKNNSLESITCVHMQVPCCFGLVRILEEAIRLSGKKISFKGITVGIKGEILNDQ